jgi:hypothetical protein
MCDHEKVRYLLAQLKELRDKRKQITQQDINTRVQALTQQEKYAVGFRLIQKIGIEVEKLKPYYETINNQTVHRADLESTRQNADVKEKVCKWYLDYLGFNFTARPYMSMLTDGEIGYQLRIENKNAEYVCKLFIAKRKTSGTAFLNWSRALYSGFIYDTNMTASAKQELREVETSMKAVVDAIWNYIQDFEALKIKIEE